MGFTEIFWKYMMKNASKQLEPGENYKDLYGVTEALKGQYLIPKLQ